MSGAQAVVVDVLLALAVALVLACSIGVAVMRDTYQRIHYLGPMALVAPLLVVLAVTVRSGWHEATGQSWLAVGFVVLASPFLSHATMRAARVAKEGDWRQRGHRSGEVPR